MKFLKYALSILAVAIITDAFIAKAYAAPTQVTILRELNKNDVTWSDYKTKNNWIIQTYYNNKSYTWMTNPCPKCKISTRLYTEGGDFSTAEITATGQTKSLNNPTSFEAPDNYRLAIKRYDMTALSTHHEGIWKIN